MFEEAHADFGFEDWADGVVDFFFFDAAGFDFGSEPFEVGFAGHVHVEAGGGSFVGGVLGIARVTVNDEAVDGVGVADDEAVEIPSGTQDIVEQEAVAGGGDVVEVHVGAHEGGDAGVARGFEGREVYVPEQFFGDVGGVVVAAPVGGAVSGEVFGGGEDVVGATPLAALEAEDLGASDGRGGGRGV